MSFSASGNRIKLSDSLGHFLSPSAVYIIYAFLFVYIFYILYLTAGQHLCSLYCKLTGFPFNDGGQSKVSYMVKDYNNFNWVLLQSNVGQFWTLVISVISRIFMWPPILKFGHVHQLLEQVVKGELYASIHDMIWDSSSSQIIFLRWKVEDQWQYRSGRACIVV